MARPGYLTDKKGLLDRLHRIEGQVRGLAAMVEEERYCIEVLDQIGAVRGALRSVATLVLADHLRSCVLGASPPLREERTREAAEAVERLLRT